ncbi:ABC-2 type transport system permease protein [Lentibacillus halodurans]|uniref:Transport permease protein n=1 Tax=Lentibacillus halodurans TaxID=237679 RepID=A0A1I0W8Z9_9BACI|nr:ABC transporter permease [Lentibacillus halodurans]SFA84386.1 ABC-2 type transport system permease protein [Lentibacillus halodurans]
MEAVFAVWQRDVIKFFRDKGRLLGSFAMPFMFLILFGSGMSGAMQSMLGSDADGGPLAEFDFVEFMFPGIIGMTVFNTAIFSALSVVQDKEFGYMREILVSPMSRVSIAVGKVLGGTTVAVIQGLMMLIFVPFIGVSIGFGMILQLVPTMFLVAFTISAIGLLIASLLKTAQGFQMVVQILLFPMLFLSGALFPLNGLPLWMDIIVKINPLTYSVDMFKDIILQPETMSAPLREAMGLDLELFGHVITFMEEVVVVGLIGAVFVVLATMKFSRSEA